MNDNSDLIKSLEKRISNLESKLNGDSVNLFGRSYSNVGSSTQDFLIKTKGQVKIQWGSKFIDLIKNGKINSESEFIFKEDSIGTQNGIYVIKDQAILVIDGQQINLSGSEGNTYVSFQSEQNLDSDKKHTALKNIGFIYDTFNDAVKDNIKSGIVYIESDSSLYIINNGQLLKYSIPFPSMFTSQFVIKKEDSKEGAIIIQGSGKQNSLKFDSFEVYNMSSDAVINAQNKIIFNIDDSNIVTFSKDGTIFNDPVISDTIQSKDASENEGFSLYVKGSESILNIDNINVRKRLYAEILQIQEAKYIGGKLFCTKAGIVCNFVEETFLGYKCYFKTSNSDGLRINNQFEVNDLAFSATFDNSNIKRWWRKVIAVGDDYIEVSKQDAEEYSSIPQPGDNIAQLGNVDETSNRRGALIIEPSGIMIYENINTFKLPEARITLSPTKTKIDAETINFIGKTIINNSFIVDLDGNLTINGKITTKEGSIGKFIINENGLYNDAIDGIASISITDSREFPEVGFSLGINPKEVCSIYSRRENVLNCTSETGTAITAYSNGGWGLIASKTQVEGLHISVSEITDKDGDGIITLSTYTDFVIFKNNNPINILFPDPVKSKGKIFILKKVGSGLVNLQGNVIKDSTIINEFQLTTHVPTSFISDGTAWYKI